ncbi:hypothetical protein DIURU_005761 [Diutina rugosa]|uniref:Uncharacterized protein n=1 Tax=Diutina rugosa TaxID=5481 RepID=A0A642UG89_DIURU|nr:uncharacterized protein DIURU_005761 [Diutina rugosa]KAA8896495.1 hypothetical protein DIURU_005761 [Diutina rugosa]
MRSFIRHRRNDSGQSIDDALAIDLQGAPPNNPMTRDLQPVMSRASGHSQHTPVSSPVVAQVSSFGSPKSFQNPQNVASTTQSKSSPKKLLTPIRNLFGPKTSPEARKIEPSRYSEENRRSRSRPSSFSRVVSNDSHTSSLMYESRRSPLIGASPAKSSEEDTFKVSPRVTGRSNKGFEVIKGMAGPPPPTSALPKKPVAGKKYIISGPIGPPRSSMSNFDAPRDAPEPPRRSGESQRSIQSTLDNTKKKRKKKRRLKPPIQFDSSKPLPPTPQGSPDPPRPSKPPALDLVESNFKAVNHDNAMSPRLYGDKWEPRPSSESRKTSESRDFVDPRRTSESREYGDSRKSSESRDYVDPRKVSETRESSASRDYGEPRKVSETRKLQDYVDSRKSSESRPDYKELRNSLDSRDYVDPRKSSDSRDYVDPRKSSDSREFTDPRKSADSREFVDPRRSQDSREYVRKSSDSRDLEDTGGRTSISSLPSHLSTPSTVHSFPGPQPLVRDDDIQEEEEVDSSDLDHSDDSNSSQFSFIKDNIGGRNTSVKYYKTINPTKDLPTPPPINNTFNEHDLGYEVDEFSDYDYENNGYDDDDDGDGEVGYNDALDEEEVGYNDALGFDEEDGMDYNDDYDVDDYAEAEFEPKPPTVGDDHSYTDNSYKSKDEEEAFHASEKRIPCHQEKKEATTPTTASHHHPNLDSLEPPPRLRPSIVGVPQLSRGNSSTGEDSESSYGDDILQNYLDMGPSPRSDRQGSSLNRGDSVDTSNFAVTPPRLLEQLAPPDLDDPQSSPQVALFPPSVAGTVKVRRRRGSAPDTPQAWHRHHQSFLLAVQNGDTLDLDHSPFRTPGLFRSFHDSIPENINVIDKVNQYESFTESRQSQNTPSSRRQSAQSTILEISVERFRHGQGQFSSPSSYDEFNSPQRDLNSENTKRSPSEARRSVNQMMELLGTLESTIDSGATSTDDKRKSILNMMDLLNQLETSLPPGSASDHRSSIMAMMSTLDAIGQRLDESPKKPSSSSSSVPDNRRASVSSMGMNKRDSISNMMSTLATLDFSLPPDEAAAAEVQLKKRKSEKHTRTTQQPLERKPTSSTVTSTSDPRKRYSWYEDEQQPTSMAESPPLPPPASAQSPMTHASFTKRAVSDDLGEDLIDEINQLPEDFDFEEHERTSSQVTSPSSGFFRSNSYKNKPIKALVDARYPSNKIETASKTVTFYKKATSAMERSRSTSRATSLRSQNSFASVTEEDEGDDNTGSWKSHDLPPLPFTLDPKFTHHHNLSGANLHTISEQR